MIEKEYDYFMGRIKRILERTEEDLTSESELLEAEMGWSKDPVPWQQRQSLEYRPINEGEVWGRDWESCWFHLTGKIPAKWAGKRVALRLEVGGEALLFDQKGVPHWSFTNTSIYCENYRKRYFILPTPAKGDEKVDYWVEAVASGLFGLEMQCDPARNNPHPYGQTISSLQYCRMVLFNEELWHFRLEFETLLSLALHYGRKDYRGGRLLQILTNACDAYCDDPNKAAAAREALKPALQWKALSSALSVSAVGHAHIDVGWLWPVRETIRKTARTFASQLRLMERYPDYVFGASQAQLYQFAKDYYPELFEEIRQRVKEGRWELQGGMWVECDCNIPSGESLVRQFLHGKNFFKDNFGIEVRNMWEPDVFGYTASLPQIIRKAGCDFFLTQKISWSRINHFPHNTFRWRGIDGTEVMTHFPPEDTYNANLLAGELAAAQDRFEERGTSPEFLSLYGIGDGGGGPKEEYLERGLLCQDLEGSPRVRFEPAQKFFDRLIASCSPKTPLWSGELYLEMHRGTLTTQARTKRNNRRLEQMLTALEFVASSLPAQQYPRKELDRLWKLLLINQFHDIIPGSSIRKVYETTEAEHQQMIQEVTALLDKLAKAQLRQEANTATLINTLSCDYKRPVELPAEWVAGTVVDECGNALPAQVESDGKVVAAVPMAAGEWKSLKLTAAEKDGVRATTADFKLTLENRLVRYTFAKNGRMLSAVRLADGKELLSAPGNVLNLYADRPELFEAWDVDSYYENEYLESAQAEGDVSRECGPVRSLLHFNLRIGNSTIRQTVSLGANTTVLEFNTQVEWHEERKMLRVAFPTVISSDEATYDIQYGYVRRPTHCNTSWDAAKFENCGQRYVDLSTVDGGVALLNDCKYGHKIRDGVLDLNLLRAPKYPDPDADLGHHEFTYAFMPHGGDVVEGGVYAAAAQLNRAPWKVLGMTGKVNAPATVVGEGVSLEVIKRGEKDDHIILRLVETRGRRSEATLRLDSALAKAKVTRTNLMEWTQEGEVRANAAGEYPLQLKPFEILTLRVAQ